MIHTQSHLNTTMKLNRDERWRTGKHVPTRIGRADGQPMGIAGLWDRWVDSVSGEIVWSFTMLTINAETPARRTRKSYCHRPGRTCSAHKAFDAGGDHAADD